MSRFVYGVNPVLEALRAHPAEVLRVLVERTSADEERLLLARSAASRRNDARLLAVSLTGMALVVLLAIAWVMTASQARAEQVSVETAAKTAGLYVEAGVENVNGASIYYRDIGARGEPLLLLHGFPETGDAFAQVVAPLGKHYRLIVPDLPVEESDELQGCCQVHGMHLVYLLAPTSTEARIASVAARATGFIYCMAVTGVTGARSERRD